MSTNREQIQVIKQLFTVAEEKEIPLWLESGWAIDARLGRVTREHEDIDIAFPEDRRQEYERILTELGFMNRQDMDYGFLVRRGPVLIDTEPCYKTATGYGFTDFPDNSCPMNKEGQIEGSKFRCVSWDHMYYEFLYYISEVPKDNWREKDFSNLRTIKNHLSNSRREQIEELFERNKR